MPGPLSLIFSRSRNPGSMLIRAWPPAGPWSHCGVIVGDAVIEATMLAGVQSTPLAEFIDRASLWDIIDLWCMRPEAGEKWALSRIGARYDWGGAAGIVLREPDLSEDVDAEYCSMMICRATRKAGNPILKPRALPHGVTPNSAWALALAADGKVRPR
jgi:hypothetical protein